MPCTTEAHNRASRYSQYLQWHPLVHLKELAVAATSTTVMPLLRRHSAPASNVLVQ